MLVSEEFTGYGSSLVLFELFGALSKLNVEAAYEAVNAYLDLPLNILELNRDTFTYAKEMAKLSNTTYDALHVALIAQNNLDIVVTEDTEDWKKISKIWFKIKRKYKAKDLVIFSPTKGVIK